jgi:hypothetical protein
MYSVHSGSEERLRCTATADARLDVSLHAFE